MLYCILSQDFSVLISSSSVGTLTLHQQTETTTDNFLKISFYHFILERMLQTLFEEERGDRTDSNRSTSFLHVSGLFHFWNHGNAKESGRGSLGQVPMLLTSLLSKLYCLFSHVFQSYVKIYIKTIHHHQDFIPTGFKQIPLNLGHFEFKFWQVC